MTLTEAKQKLEAEGQGHVLEFWPGLDEVQRQNLLTQIDNLDLTLVAAMRKLLPGIGSGVSPGGSAGNGGKYRQPGTFIGEGSTFCQGCDRGLP